MLIMTKKNIAIIDIDGTIANIDHRLHLIQHNNPEDRDWDAFHADCINDAPITEMIDLVNCLSVNYIIVLITSRMERNRTDTTKWLDTHGLFFDRLHMRKENDYRMDAMIKPEMLSKEDLQRVAFAIDDRQQVVDMWRALGIRTLQCDVGNF